MKIVILTIALVQGDATGNDIFCEYQSLKEEGFDVYLYAEQYDSFYASLVINRKKLNEIISYKENLLIYHHGIYWEQGGEIINDSECRSIFKYHNITPSEFFKDYNISYFTDSYEGRKQTEQFVNNNKFNFYLADSKYNAGEIKSYGVPKEKNFLLPPFNKIHDFDSVKLNIKLLKTLQDGKINILFVSRILPHKGLHHIIKVLEQYIHHYGDAIRLNIIGSIDTELDKYMGELEEVICQNQLEDYVYFRGKVNFSELKTYYAASHALLVMSEHEGFCLPIIEAQYHKVPVIALDRCAVKDTLGKEQLLLQDIDYKLFASAIHILSSNKDMREYLIDKGRENYLKYEYSYLSCKFLNLVNKTLNEHGKVKTEYSEVFYSLGKKFSILLIKLDHLGDFLLAIPAIMRLKEKFKNAEIDIIVGEWNVQFAKKLNIFRNIYVYNFFKAKSSSPVMDKPERDIRKEKELLSKMQKYDIAVDLRRSQDTRFFLASVNAKFKVGYDSFSDEYNKSLNVCLNTEKEENSILQNHNFINMSLQLLKLVDAIPLEVIHVPKLINVPPDNKEIAIFPFAGHTLKQWPIENYFILAREILENQLASKINLYLSKSEEKFADQFKNNQNIIVNIGLKLDQLIESLSKNYLSIANNSFGAHISSYLGIPLVAIYGGQDTVWEWQPPFGNNTIIYSDIGCSPCHLIDVKECPNDIICLKQITPEYVFDKIKEQLGKGMPAERPEYFYYMNSSKKNKIF